MSKIYNFNHTSIKHIHFKKNVAFDNMKRRCMCMRYIPDREKVVNVNLKKPSIIEYAYVNIM